MRASAAEAAVSCALAADSATACPTSSAERRADSTMRTCRSAPLATSPMAFAISPTARPASSEVDAICCDADEMVAATVAVWPTSVRRASTICWKARVTAPISSEEWSAISTVRSPSATLMAPSRTS